MPTIKPTCQTIQPYLQWRLLAGWLAVFLICLSLPSAGSASDAELFMQEVSYTTEDNLTISGSWIIPQSDNSKSEKFPVVILLHDYGFDRRDWGIFIPTLIQQGFGVLVIDLRGHGKSTSGGMRLSGKYSVGSSSYLLTSGPFDVLGALDWLKPHKDVDLKHVALVGVGAGGDLAYLCARKYAKRVRSAVVISPSLATLTEGSFTNTMPRGILFCASTGDASGSSMMAAESLANFTDSPKKVLLYQSNAHGLAMFYKHPDMTPEILTWLRQ